MPGIPPLKDIDTLAEFLTVILFTCTVQHSAVNFGQYDYYAFVPNRPLILMREMPQNKSLINSRFILSALATTSQTEDTIAVTKVLSLPPTEQIDPLTGQTLGYTLASFPIPANWSFTAQYNELHAKLGVLQDQFAARNKHAYMGVPYDYLLPHQIASSIAI